MLRIDAHHHLWRYNAAEYGWLEGDLAMLRRDFVVDDLKQAMRQAGVSGTVAVQARQALEETSWLLQLAAANPFLLGVVGWLPLRDPKFSLLLEQHREQQALKGLRHVVQGEAPGFLDDSAFNAGIEAMQGTGLVYDILIFERQLEEATRFVDRHPNQIFVLDHIAKPKIKAGELQPWADKIAEFAKRENVFCKISGMVTEADPKQWTSAQLKVYFDTVLESFTPARLLVGSDWPVICAGCSYERWWTLLGEWISPLSFHEQADILGRAAIRIYRLQEPTFLAQEDTRVPT
jgi:L-fuconolactonase